MEAKENYFELLAEYILKNVKEISGWSIGRDFQTGAVVLGKGEREIYASPLWEGENWIAIQEEERLIEPIPFTSTGNLAKDCAAYVNMITAFLHFFPVNDFPNGFTSWHEAHYEIVASIAVIMLNDEPHGIVASRQDAQGHGGLYELAQELTDEFERIYTGFAWDGEFYEEVDKFFTCKNEGKEYTPITR